MYIVPAKNLNKIEHLRSISCLKGFDYHYKYYRWLTRFFIFQLASSITAPKDLNKVVNKSATSPKYAPNVHCPGKKSK